MKRGLVVTPRRCIGCRTCELACSFVHAVDGALGTTRVRVSPVVTEAQRHLPLLCLQCSQAACVAVCPTRALRRNEATGAIELDERRCVRCRLCVVACPFGNLAVDPGDGAIIKCDLCGGDPACARFCPSQALEFKVVEGLGVLAANEQAPPHESP